MPKILVAYYSQTGHTRQIAEETASALGADVDEIRDAGGAREWPRSPGLLWKIVAKRPAEIAPAGKRPEDYDLVVIGTPIWMFRLSPPVRAFLRLNGASFAQVAFFCTEGGAGGERAFGEMARIVGKEPVAKLIVTEPDLEVAKHSDRLDAFVAKIRGAV